MARVINATEETVTVQVAGTYFTFKPGQAKTIRNNAIAQFIQTERRESGLAVLPDLTSQEEDDGDVELTSDEMSSRKASRKEEEASACALALNNFIRGKRDIIANNQIHLKRDLAVKNLGDPEHYITDGELDAMRLVAKYDRKGKDAAQERINEINKLKKEISGK